MEQTKKISQFVMVIIYCFIFNVLIFQSCLAHEKIVLQLRWFHQFQFAGYYAAVEKGFYDNEDIEVEFVEGGPFNTVDPVISGKADFGIASSELVIERIKGKPLVVLAAFFQHSPQIIITRPKEGIAGPHDLVGKSLSMAMGIRSAAIQAIFKNEGIPLEKIRIIPHKIGYRNFLDKSISAYSGYISNQPFYFRQANIPIQIIYPRNYGIDFYGDCLFTSENKINNNSEQVNAFIKANIRGWNYALENTDEMVELILKKYSSKKSREHLLFEAEKTKELMLQDIVETGHINPERWKAIADTYARLEFINSDYNLKGFIYNPMKSKIEKSDRFQKFILLAFGIGLGIIFFSFLWIQILRKIVNTRTSDLLKEINERIQGEKLLRKSKQRLRSILNATIAAVVLIDRQGIVIDSNEVYSKRFNMNRNELIGQCIWNLFPLDLIQKRKNLVEEVFLTGKPIRTEDERNGMWNDYVIYPIYDSSGKVVNVTVYAQDITEQKQAEQQLIQADKMASLGLLSSGVAHEINNPVNLILLNSSLLKDIWKDFYPVLEKYAKQDPHKSYGGLKIDYLRQKLHVLLNDTHLAARRIESIVANLKNFAKKSDICLKEPIQINIAVKNAFKLAESTLNKTNIEIMLDLDNELPQINGNKQNIEQIVLNLIINSIQAHENNKGKIEIRTQYHKLKNQIDVYVKDTGKGIKPDISENLFDPFFTTRQADGGTGLGLSIVYNLVKSHNGKISFDSKPGKGTIFKVSFPV